MVTLQLVLTLVAKVLSLNTLASISYLDTKHGTIASRLKNTLQEGLKSVTHV